MLSVVIPTYLRGSIALETVRLLLALPDVPDEIVLVDQTPQHPPDIEAELERLSKDGRIRWIRGLPPSIPGAMNAGLLAAHGDAVVFLDDDVVPDAGLITAHRNAVARFPLVAGQVLQPGQSSMRLAPGEPFRFNSPDPAKIMEFIGCNFSVNRGFAIGLGGFDENFVGAAYRYEAEFAARSVAVNGPIHFEPAALLRHLALPTGGTRAHAHHLRTSRPTHSVGAYYFLLRAKPKGWVSALLWRPIRSVRTRFHLSHPWRIPASLMAEARGFLLARRLFRAGPRLIVGDSNDPKASQCA